MIQLSAHQALDHVEDARLHLVDPVALFQLRDTERSATRTTAELTKMIAVAASQSFHRVALLAAVLRHKAEALSE